MKLLIRARDLSPRVTGPVWLADLHDPRRCRRCGIMGGGWIFGTWWPDGSVPALSPWVCLVDGAVSPHEPHPPHLPPYQLLRRESLALLRRLAGWPRSRWWVGFASDPLRGLPVDGEGTYWQPPTTSPVSLWSSE